MVRSTWLVILIKNMCLYFMGSETLPSTCYILSDESSIGCGVGRYSVPSATRCHQNERQRECCHGFLSDKYTSKLSRHWSAGEEKKINI